MSTGKILIGFVIASLLAVIILGVPAWHAASAKDGDTGAMLVAFNPAMSETDMLNAITKAGGLPVKQAPFGPVWQGEALWAVQAAGPGFLQAVKAHGAWGVFNNLPDNGVLVGCTGIVVVR